MFYMDLNDNQRRRFNRASICPICHQKISPNENFILVKRKNRRCKQYIFYHTGCLSNERKKEKTW